MRLNLTLAGGGRKKSGNPAPAAAIGNIASSIATGGAGGNVISGSGGSATGTPSSLAGAIFGGVKKPVRPKPKAATGNIRDQAVNIGNQAAMRNGAENIRNTGGGRGVEIAQAVRALKGLTGK